MQAEGFTFGFYDEPKPQELQGEQNKDPAPVPIESVSLGRMLKYIPSKLSYACVHGLPYKLVQRELWDVKMQLMENDSLESTPIELKLLDSANDLVPKVYEGGFKTWECSIDLCHEIKKLNILGRNLTRVLELGCGSALPILTCFQELYQRREPSTLIFQDYNIDVLRYITLPNLLLNWYFNTQEHDSSQEHGTINVSESLLQEFSDDFARNSITCEFLSGPWGSEMQSIIQQSYGDQYFSLILASETIYSISSLEPFIYMLLENTRNISLIAGKDLYFGVGGSVLEFYHRLQNVVSSADSLKTVKSSVNNVGRSIVYWERASAAESSTEPSSSRN
ncbi:S-adenosylmethionine-dependent methyltransferase [Schizosaccharomyces cryophilus OY26]|uniref:protein-histidine N-methyltransferase n=1 Tax=Schizosaccharomyces cryophilus (strain OY26 / ATCC MYA-4695 / CBS 11777 / NBRC 106824 / NRRL Y48691) TaxID=653667 RepID=S9XCF8_SCHCR|nr:S-adenosylmethionine-dependent methyltransferase [Schizosaccharomyces cryophilus OY26]EPY51536.1 S-adenosylmethionine-dependent methyltransferase [Schizosaccharomyces cryophilus OY26]